MLGPKEINNRFGNTENHKEAVNLIIEFSTKLDEMISDTPFDNKVWDYMEHVVAHVMKCVTYKNWIEEVSEKNQPNSE